MHYESILCLNGNLPNKDFFIKEVPIIAADGAADKLLDIGVKPDIVIGDLDSIKNIDKFKVVHTPNQDESDFQKALKYLEQNQLLPTLILGTDGGFIDHILFNIDIIMRNKCIFYSPPIIGYPLEASTKFSFKLGSKISIFAMPEAKISTSGLKWELNNSILKFPGFNSLSNEVVKENIKIEIQEGAILLLVHVDEASCKI